MQCFAYTAETCSTLIKLSIMAELDIRVSRKSPGSCLVSCRLQLHATSLLVECA